VNAVAAAAPPSSGGWSVDVVGRLAIWALFFASSAYGHVALKLAVGRADVTYRNALWNAATSLWGWSAVLAWTLSCVLWAMAISRQKLMVASSVSSLSYALLCVAAWAFLGERVTWPQATGVVLIVAGILLVK
jgi:drug/metabolite transporter (DMT)-like permease